MADKLGWDDLKVFLAISRQGTIRKAAKELSVSHSTIARRLDALEERLGARLFDKLPTGYALNAAGERVVAHAASVEREIHSLERSISGHDGRLAGPIQLTIVPPMASILMPILLDFRAVYPQIEIEVLATYEIVDLARRDADIAIRFDSKPEPWLVGRRLPPLGNAAYATESYIEAHTFVGEHASACWIGWRGDDERPDWISKTGFPDCRAHWQVNDALGQQEAARAEIGMALLPCWIGDRDPDLIRVPPGRVEHLHRPWILTHPDLRTSARVRALVAFISSSFADLAPTLRGGPV